MIKKIENNKEYTLVLSLDDELFNNIKYNEQIMSNDVFEKYKVTCCPTKSLNGELFICNDISKLSINTNIIIKETYDEYLDYIKSRDVDKDQWIYNIIDGIAEKSQILYKDEECIIIPDFKFDRSISKLHILCMPIDKTIRCIRSLEQKHIELLKNMKEKTLKEIKTRYNLDECNLKIYIHYNPSTYHLHIHFINVNYTDCFSSVEYSHEIHSVMDNLSMNSCYYRKVKLNVRR
jgi:m7GpppX diphosphatase